MARARNLKPGFFKDAKIVGCSFEARLLFQGLWCMADYKGRLKYVPLEMKMEVFPADNVDVEKCCKELHESGLIEIYQDHSGSTLVQVQNFEKHQNPHVNERKDKSGNWMPALPGPEDCKRNGADSKGGKETTEQRVKGAIRVLQEYYRSDPADSLLLIPDSLFPSTTPPKSPKGDSVNYDSWPELPDPQILKDWIASRKKAKATHSQTAINNIGKELHKAKDLGFSVNDCLSEAVTRGWRGLKAEWMQNAQGRSVSTTGQQGDYNGDGWADGFDPLQDPADYLVNGDGSEGS